MTTISHQNGQENHSMKNQHESDHNKKRSANDMACNEIQDEVLFVNDDDFIEGLDVVDAWEGDDDNKDRDGTRRRSWDRFQGKHVKEKRGSRGGSRERDRHHDKSSRGDRRRSRSRERERRREAERRDPRKSNKDIEQDKLRAKKDSDSKILAEKEKAIKNLLDSDNVVPPGTEGEALQNLEKNQKPVIDLREEILRKRGVDHRSSPRRKSPTRRHSSRKSPNFRRSPITFSPERRRRRRSSPSPEKRRSRETSLERKEASRKRLRERERSKYLGRRSRSRDRVRSRTPERRRRSRTRESRERRHSPRRRSRSHSRSSSIRNTRKRSPFINEIARQFRNDPLGLEGPPGSSGPIMPGQHANNPEFNHQSTLPGILPQYRGEPYIHPMMPNPGVLHSGPGPQGTGIMPVPQGMPGIPMMDIHMNQLQMIPGGSAMMQPGLLQPGVQGIPEPQPYLNFDGCPPPGLPMNYENPSQAISVSEFSSGPVMYNQNNQQMLNSMQHPPSSMRAPSPKPVPAPGISATYRKSVDSSHHQKKSTKSSGAKYSPHDRSLSPVEDRYRDRYKSSDRMRTPEPPIISDFKSNEKASLSSLLEASVSSKDFIAQSVSEKGFKPEILRQCERALRSLPNEDPRLKMKGRFFFDPEKGENKDKKETSNGLSNSVLLRKGRTEIHWDEEEDKISASRQELSSPVVHSKKVTHQKICQTDPVITECQAVQTTIETTNCSTQIFPYEFPNIEDTDERRFTDRRQDDRRLEDRRMEERLAEERRLLEDKRMEGLLEERRLEDERRRLQEERRRLEEERRILDERLVKERFDDRRLEEGRFNVRQLSEARYDDRRLDEGRSLDRRLEEELGRFDDTRLNDRILEDRRSDDRRQFTDRLDWSMRETFDHAPKLQDSEDLRWSLSSSQQKRNIQPWSSGRVLSPSRSLNEMVHGTVQLSAIDHSRNVIMNPEKIDRSIEDFSPRKKPLLDNFSNFNRPHDVMERNVNMLEINEPLQSGSPDMEEEDPDDLEIIEERGFDREPWQRGSSLNISHNSFSQRSAPRGNSRPFRSRGGGSYRMKF